MKNHIESKIKTLRTYNGMEFFHHMFNKFCRDHGIDRHRAIRLTPRQNGRAKKLNITLLEMIRCMLA